MGKIYLLQPAELLGTNRYKIGCSNKDDLSRCINGYKSGTKHILIMDIDNPTILESKLKKLFKENFNIIAGYEYFEGNINEMIDLFLTTYRNIKINNLVCTKSNKNKVEDDKKKQNVKCSNIKCCPKCKKIFKYSSYLKNHLSTNVICKMDENEIEILFKDSKKVGVLKYVDKNNELKCSTCGKEYKYKTGLYKHYDKDGICKNFKNREISADEIVQVLQKENPDIYKNIKDGIKDYLNNSLDIKSIKNKSVY